jgi:hypothetical protein
MGCGQDGEERSITVLRLPHVCASWCEVGHCREGEGRLSCFGYVRANDTDALSQFV